MRKLLVKHFVLGTFVTVFGKTFNTLRAPRVLFPLFCITGTVIAFDSQYPKLQWYDLVLLGLIFIGVWLGFGFFKWSYFRMKPAQYNELDKEQKFIYLDAVKKGVLTNSKWKMTESGDMITLGLSEAQKKEFRELQGYILRKYYGQKFAGLGSLVSPAIGVLIVIVGYLIFKL